MSIGTEVEIPDVIGSISLIEMSIEPECDSEWSREYFDSLHDKKMAA